MLKKSSLGKIDISEAVKLAPDYVSFIQGNFNLFGSIEEKFEKLKKGDFVISYRNNHFVKCKVSQVSRNDPRAIDGPLVRVIDNECSWRVDGCRYAYPI